MVHLGGILYWRVGKTSDELGSVANTLDGAEGLTISMNMKVISI